MSRKTLKQRKLRKSLSKNTDSFKSYATHGASRTKKTVSDWNTHSFSPAHDIGDNQKLLRERSRDLTQGGSSIGIGALKKLKTNVVGVGLKMKSTIDDEFLGIDVTEKRKLERNIERVWELWAESKNCDITRLDNFYQLTALIFYSYLQNGDAFALLPYLKRVGDPFGLKIQLIESDRCKSPLIYDRSKRIRNGVETNKNGEVIAYYFTKRHPGEYQMLTNDDLIRVEAFGAKTGHPNVLCVMERERIGQTRGVPLLSPVIEDVKQLARYTEAEIMSAVINAFFSIFIENEKEETQGFGELINPEDEKSIAGDSYADQALKLGFGNILELGPGQKAKSITPGRPNAQFDAFVTSTIKQIGSALEIPYEVLLNQFNSSYSASRAALLEVWKLYRKKRANLVSDFCQPVFEKFMDESVAKGYINAPGYFNDPLTRKAYLKNEWHGPAQGQLNPYVEAKAAVLKIENDLSTRSRESREMNGSDWEANVKQRKIEEEERSEMIAKTTKTNLPNEEN